MIYLELLREYKSHCTNSIELEGLIELDLHTVPIPFTPIYVWQSPEPIAMLRGE